MSVKIYSYDVFDTCFIRACIDVNYIHYQTASLIKDITNDLNFNIENFVYQRVRVEKILRSQTSGEVLLNHIWEKLSLELDIDIIKYSYIEYLVELENVIPNLNILREIVDLRKNNKIFFVSDTYYDRDFIYYLLNCYGFSNCQDEVITSSFYNKTKASGELFKKLITLHESINFYNILHKGDNFNSDYLIPQRFGIKSTFYNETKLNDFQKQILKSLNNIEDLNFLNLLRISSVSGAKKIQKTISDFYFPFLVLFSEYIINICKHNKIRNLFCCSRDCRLLFEVLSKIIKSRGLDIEVKYLVISRRIIYISNIYEISEDSLKWIFVKNELAKVEILLDKLGLNANDFKNELNQFNLVKQSVIDTDELKQIFFQFLQIENVKRSILIYAESQRSIYRKYLKQLKFNDLNSAIVDLGWNLNILHGLRILYPNINLKGIYLGLTENRLNYKVDKDVFALFYRIPSNEKLFSTIFDNITLLEHIIGYCDHGTVLSFNEVNCQIIPEYQDTEDSISVKFEELLKNLSLSVDYYINFKLNNGINEYFIKYYIQILINNLFNSSSKELISELSELNILVSIYHNNVNSKKLIQKIGLIDLVKKFYYKRVRNANYNEINQILWSYSSQRISNSFIYFIYSKI